MLYLLRMKFFVIFIVLLLGTSIAQVRAEDTAPYHLSNVSSVLNKARAEAKNITLPVNKHSEAGQKAAKETADVFYSPEFQNRMQCQQQRLEKEVFRDYISPWKKEAQQPDSGKAKEPGSLAATEKVYLFISSSVPEETIHAYLADIARVGDPDVSSVMRGAIQGIGNKKANAQYFSQLLKIDPDCQDERIPKKICPRLPIVIKVNPILFTKYGITRVPAVVYVKDEDIFIIQGDAGLDYLLERINREAKSTTLASLIKKIQGSGR
ncbi:hypothetical protein KKC22_20680 [Myxococcota bacterium]|nr:hypothetical protein [Myxococcota bacterium]